MAPVSKDGTRADGGGPRPVGLGNRKFSACGVLCSPRTLTADEDRKTVHLPPRVAFGPILHVPQKLCGKNAQVHTHAQLRSQTQLLGRCGEDWWAKGLGQQDPWKRPLCASVRDGGSPRPC